jgi:PAS domain S-box-containing protein
MAAYHMHDNDTDCAPNALYTEPSDSFASAPIGMALVGMDGRCRQVNYSLCSFFGCSAHELAQLPCRELIHPEDRPDTRPKIRQLLAGEAHSFQVEQRYHRSDGATVWGRTGVSLVRDDDGSPLHFVVQLEDISTTKRAADTLIRSEEYFRALIENSSDVITILNRDGSVRYESPSLSRVLGYEPEELLGRNAFDFIHPDDVALARETMQDLVSQHGAVREIEIRLRHKDSSWRFFLCTSSNLLHHAAVGGVVTNAREITERKLAEETLRERKLHLRHLMNQAGDALFVHDLRGRIVDVNQKACESLGYSSGELLSMHVTDVEQNLTPKAAQRILRKLKQQPYVTFHGTHRRKDGTTFPVEVRVGQLESRGQQLILGLARDITERHHIENALRESEIFARSTLDALSSYIAILDEHGTILAVNRAWREHNLTEAPLSTINVQGANYLEVCEAPSTTDGSYAARFARGVRDVIAGRREFFALEYSCGRGEAARWFVGRVTRFYSQAAPAPSFRTKISRNGTRPKNKYGAATPFSKQRRKPRLKASFWSMIVAS